MATPNATPTTEVVEETPTPTAEPVGSFDAQQLQTQFQSLTPEQQTEAGGQEGFAQSALIEQQKGIADPSLGRELNLDVALGNLAMERQKQEAKKTPAPVITDEAGREFVDKSSAKLEADRVGREEFDRQDTPESKDTDTSGLSDELKAQFESETQSIDDEFDANFQRLEDYRINLNARTQNQIKQIQGRFERLRNASRIKSSNRLRGLEIMGTRSGRQRFAPVIQDSILSAEEKAGMQAIADLHAQEEQLILTAQAANDDGNFELLGLQMQAFKEKREQKNAAIDSLFNKTLQLEQLSLAKSQERRAVSAENRAISGEVRDAQRFQFEIQDRAREDFFTQFEVSPESFAGLGGGDKDKIETRLGFGKGFIDAYNETVLAERETAGAIADFEFQEKLIDLRNKIPEGQSITIGGQVIPGLKKVTEQKFKPEIIKDKDGKVTGIWDPNTQTVRDIDGVSWLGNFGEITGFGSPAWKHGLDVDLAIGDPVISASAGEVIQVDTGHTTGEKNSFGNRVKVRLDDGRELWYSHLDQTSVNVGDIVGAGQVLGTGGNTGTVIPGEGGDGSHLDLTMTDGQGGFMTPQQVVNFAEGTFANEFKKAEEQQTDFDQIRTDVASMVFDGSEPDSILQTLAISDPGSGPFVIEMLQEAGIPISEETLNIFSTPDQEEVSEGFDTAEDNALNALSPEQVGEKTREGLLELTRLSPGGIPLRSALEGGQALFQGVVGEAGKKQSEIDEEERQLKESLDNVTDYLESVFKGLF